MEEAVYYQVTGLMNWCKTKGLVISKEILALAEREEELYELLSHEVLAKLAKHSIEGEHSSLFENGVNGSLVGKVGVVFVGHNLKNGKEYRGFKKFLGEWCGYQPFDVSRNFICIGREVDHHCYIDPDERMPVSLAIYYNDVINPIVCLRRAIQRFNQADAQVQLDLQKFTSIHGRLVDPIVKSSTCGRTGCGRDVYFFIFKFLFHATSRPAQSNR